MINQSQRFAPHPLLFAIMSAMVLFAATLAAQEQGSTSFRPVEFGSFAKNRYHPVAKEILPFKNPETNMQDIHDWAYDPSTGMMAAIGKASKSLRIYAKVVSDFDGMLTNQIKLPRTPKRIIFKEGKEARVLIVAYESKHLQIYDAKSLKLLKDHTFTSSPIENFAAPTSKEYPFVYYWCERAQSRSSGKFGRINVDTLEVQHFSGAPFRSQGIEALRFDEKGDVAFSIRQSRMDRSEGLWTRIEESQDSDMPTFTFEPTDILGSGQPKESPFSRSAYPRRGFRSITLRDSTGNPGRIPLSDETSNGIRIRGTEILIRSAWREPVFYSIHTRKKIATPKFLVPEGSPSFSGFAQDRCFQDLKRGKIILASQWLVRVIDIDELGIADRPLCAFGVEGELEIPANKAMKWKVIRESNDATFSISKGPEGMTYKDGYLHWKPTKADAGVFSAVLRMEYGKRTITLVMKGMVGSEGVILENINDHAAVSPSGKFIASLSKTYVNQGAEKSQRVRMISVVDVESVKIIATREVPREAHQVAINDSFVVYTSSRFDRIVVLKRDDLSEVKKIVAPVRSGFSFLGEDTFFCVNAAHDFRFYTLPEWRVAREDGVIKPLSEETRRHFGRYPLPDTAPRPIGQDSIFYLGTLYDAKSGKVKSTLDLGTGQSQTRSHYPSDTSLATTWGYSERTDIFAAKNSSRRSSHQSRVDQLLLKDRPIKCKLEVVYSQPYQAVLTLYEIQTMTAVRIQVIDTLSTNVNQVKLLETKNHIACFYGKKLAFYEKPPRDEDTYPTPLGFKLDEGVIRVSPNSPKSSKIEFSLLGNLEGLYLRDNGFPGGVEIAKEAAYMTIDRDKLYATAESDFKDTILMLGGTSDAAQLRKKVNVATLKERVRNIGHWRAKHALGIDGDKIFRVFYSHLTIENDLGESVSRAYSIVLEIDDKFLAKAIESAAKSLE